MKFSERDRQALGILGLILIIWLIGWGIWHSKVQGEQNIDTLELNTNSEEIDNINANQNVNMNSESFLQSESHVQVSTDSDTSNMRIILKIRNLSFGTDQMDIPMGATVVWVNEDSVNHTVTANNGLFDSGNMAPGQSYKRIFDTAGQFPYYCRNHPDMKSIINVN